MGLLSKYGIPVPRGQVATTPEEAYRIAQSFSSAPARNKLILAARDGRFGGKGAGPGWWARKGQV